MLSDDRFDALSEQPTPDDGDYLREVVMMHTEQTEQSTSTDVARPQSTTRVAQRSDHPVNSPMVSLPSTLCSRSAASQLVLQSWRMVNGDLQVLGDAFYGILFEQAPALRSTLFGGADLRTQSLRLMQMLNLAVDLVDDEALVARLRALGERHAGYGTAAQHYVVVRQAFVQLMKRLLGEMFTPEMEDAWTQTLLTITEAMMQGAASEKGQQLAQQFAQRKQNRAANTPAVTPAEGPARGAVPPSSLSSSATGEPVVTTAAEDVAAGRPSTARSEARREIAAIERFLYQIDSDGESYEAQAIIRLLLAGGITVPEDLRKLAASSGTISRDDLIQALEKQEEELVQLNNLSRADEADLREEYKTVGPSRVLISSRISALASKSKTTRSWRFRAFEVAHYVTILYYFVVVTYFCVIHMQPEPLPVYVSLVIVTLLWVADTVQTLASPLVDSCGQIVEGAAAVAAAIPHRITLDAVCALPLDLILYHYCEPKPVGLYASFESGFGTLNAFLVLRVIKLLKPLRMFSLFEFTKFDEITPEFVTFYFLVKPTLRMIALSVIVVQMLVVWMSFVQDDPTNPDRNYIDNAVYVISMLSGAGVNVAFHSTEATVLEFILLFGGVLVQASIISNLTVTVFRNDVDAMNVEQMRETLSILDHFHVPSDVSTEILSFQLHALSDDVSVRLSTLETLPSNMQREVMLFVKVAAVNTVRLFTKASHECKMKIAQELVQTVVPPMTNIVSVGDAGEEMFLIAHGYATVIIFTGATVAMLSRGDYFGEVALLLPNNIRQATVRALTYCDLWVLDKKAFLRTVHEFPNLMDAMADDLKEKNVDVATLKAMRKSVDMPPPRLEVSTVDSVNHRHEAPPRISLPTSTRQSMSSLSLVPVWHPLDRPSLTSSSEIPVPSARRQTSFATGSGTRRRASEVGLQRSRRSRSPSSNGDSGGGVAFDTEPVVLGGPIRQFEDNVRMFNTSARQQSAVRRRSKGRRVSAGSPSRVEAAANPAASGRATGPDALLAPAYTLTSMHSQEVRLGESFALGGNEHPSGLDANVPPQTEAELLARVALLENQLLKMARDVQQVVAHLVP